ncbi:PREDICTED: uncharacterized protein LOC109207699 [Nicotiana attenuata]|uniref:DUF4283 domain-containing protein n=1 Tax=Nicotiana attenuata TaxID=49451 RepID=A0A314KST4_NICAT|nr:PREDICTED: uncharacterized protein LOC109207699 [Nicotiana attenuata]OIT32167.1 hypothetical protein A4A49_38330 [Nicotiana attenuata]
MGKTLNYVPPAIRDGTFIVQINAEDTREREIYWSTALIEYVLGDNPYEKSMDNYITNVWNFVEKPQILYHDEDYYIFRFQNTEERDLVLQAGPYTYHNKPLILQHWSMDFKFDPGCMSVIPLWIKFSGLPLGFCSIEVLSKLASVVGKPLYTDRITAEMEKVSYARVLVEADVSHPLPDSFEMQTPRGIINQQIEHDWKPKYCCDCIRFGHNSNECWMKEKLEKEKEFKEQPKRKRNKNKTNLQWLPKEHRGNETGQLGGQRELGKQTEGMQTGVIKQSMPEGCTQMANDKSEKSGQNDQNTRTIGKGKAVQQAPVASISSSNRFGIL